MSTTEHPAWYYQQKDITDPTPYEYEPRQWGDLECTMCGFTIFRGEDVVIFNHEDLVRKIVMHKECFPHWLKEDPHMWESIKRFMELLDFEIEEGEIP